MKKIALISSLTFVVVLGIIGIIAAVSLNRSNDVNPEDSHASSGTGMKLAAASLCSSFNPSLGEAEIQRRVRELAKVDGIHCRFDWNSIQTGETQYDFSELANWIRRNNQYGKKSVIGIMTRADYMYDCTTPYQAMPSFLLQDSKYDPIAGNPHTAAFGDEAQEGSCGRGTPFTWPITYKQVNYTDSDVKTSISNMVNAFATYLRNTELQPGSGNGLKLIDAMGGVEISMGHQGEPRPTFTGMGAKTTPNSQYTMGFWQACPTSLAGYDTTHPERYSDWCHYVMKWGNGDPYSAAANWVGFQTWMVNTYKNAFQNATPLYANVVGSMMGNGENGSTIETAASIGVGLRTTGISANQGIGGGPEYRDNEYTYANWWNNLRKHWDDALKPPIVVEHGTSDIPEFNSASNQRNPNLFYWTLLAGLSMHTDQFHLLAEHFQPSYNTTSGFVTGLNDEVIDWAKPYIGAEREDSPGAFAVLRENAYMRGKLSGSEWFDNTLTQTKWQAGEASGSYYADRGFGRYNSGYIGYNSTDYTGNYDFFLSVDNGRGEQNIPEWNYQGNYSPVNGRVDPNFPKEGMFYRRTDKASSRNEFCFNLEDQFKSLRGSSGNYQINVKYRDDNMVFDLIHKNGSLPSVAGTGSRQWRTTTFNLTNATFNNDYVNGNGRNYDFCIRRMSGNDDLALHIVEVKPQGGGNVPPATQAQAPTFNPNGGTFTNSVSVTLSSSTLGATIRYTTDGSNPSSSLGTIYSVPFALTSTTTIKAIAYKSGMSDSSLSSATFTIQTGTGGGVVTSQFDVGLQADEMKTLMIPDNSKLIVVGVKQNPNVRTGIPDCNGSIYGLCGNGDVYAMLIDLTSRTKVADVLVAGDTNSTSILDQEYGFIEYNSTRGEYLVGWEELPANANPSNFNGMQGNFDVGYDIYVQRIAINGNSITKIGSKLAVSTANDSQWVPQIAYNSDDNEYLLTWHDHRNRGAEGTASQKDIFAQRLGFDGDSLVLRGSNFSITKTGSANALYYQEYSALVYDNTNDRYLAVWHDARTSHVRDQSDIWGQFISRTGDFIGVNFEIINDAGSLGTMYPNLAEIAPGNGFTLVWNQLNDTTTRDAGLAVLNRDGGRVFGPVKLATASISSTYFPMPSVSCSDLKCSVLWQENRNMGIAEFNTSNPSGLTKRLLHSGSTYLNNQNANNFSSGKVSSFMSNGETLKVFVETDSGGSATAVVNPTLNPGTSSFDSSVSVSMSTSTAGAVIRYTTNGTEPSETSTLYSNPITLSITTTLKAKAFKTGMTNSGTVSATYTKTSLQAVATPVFTPSGGVFTSTIDVSMSSATPGAVIKYTTDGTEPSAISTTYNSLLTFTSTTTLKAKAYKDGMNPSTTRIATYTANTGTTNDIVITAFGERANGNEGPCSGGEPNMLVKYNSISVGSRCVSSEVREYIFPVNGSYTDASKITIHFTNDQYVAGVEDRNLWIKTVAFGGLTYPGQEALYGKGHYTAQYGCGTQSTDPERVINATQIAGVPYYSITCNNGYIRAKLQTTYCANYDINDQFDARDGSSPTDNIITLKGSEISTGKLLVSEREVISDMTPSNTNGVNKCWGRVINSSTNAVVCSSSQVFCTWSGGKTYLKGQSSTIAGGCKLPVGSYKTEIFLQNSSSQVLQSCKSSSFNVRQ